MTYPCFSLKFFKIKTYFSYFQSINDPLTFVTALHRNLCYKTSSIYEVHSVNRLSCLQMSKIKYSTGVSSPKSREGVQNMEHTVHNRSSNNQDKTLMALVVRQCSGNDDKKKERHPWGFVTRKQS